MINHPDHQNTIPINNDIPFGNAYVQFMGCVLGGDCSNHHEIMKLHQQLAEAAKLAASLPRTPKQVVFVSDIPRSREAKLAFGLKQNGWDTILLYKEPPSFDTEKYFSQAHRYQTAFNALLLSLHYSPTVFHLFSCWDFVVTVAFILYKPGKIIFDNYDVFAGMVNEASCDEYKLAQFHLERFCFENADGHCCRSLETQHAKRHLGYKFRGKRIFFTDYCWDMGHQPDTRKSLEAEPLLFANVGNLYLNHLVDVEHKDNYHLKLAMALAELGIGSMIYMSFFTEELGQFVQQSTGGNPLISIKNLPYETMLSEMQTRCHAGLICAPPSITSESNRHFYLQRKRDFGIGNKAFDYIDAGLTVIIAPESKFLYWLIKRYHNTLDFDLFISEPGKYLQIIRDWKHTGGEKLFSACKKLSVSVQAKRLISFYENI